MRAAKDAVAVVLGVLVSTAGSARVIWGGFWSMHDDPGDLGVSYNERAR
jgi:hypothetical protein